MDFIEACRKIIAADSSPGHGTKRVGELAAQLCEEKGLQVEFQNEIINDIEEVNLIARHHGKERPSAELMLQCHLDTIDPGPFALWKHTGHNPFDAHIIDGKIYGLGSADVKLDFICKLEAMSSFSSSTAWKLPPVLVGTYGEELGMSGALRLIRKNKVTAKMALIGEPSNLQILSAGKGLASVEIIIPYSEAERNYRAEHNLLESTSTQSKIFNGKASHSSTPHLGDSAIKKMFDFLLNLPSGVIVMEIDGGVNFNTVPSHAFLEIDLAPGSFDAMSSKISTIYRGICELEKQFLEVEDHDFFPKHPTLNIGVVKTHDDYVMIEGCCRIPPGVSISQYEVWMNFLKQKCHSVGAEFRITDYKRPFRTKENGIFYRGCRSELESMGITHKMSTQASTNEASLFSRIGVECLCFGPGRREENIHTPNEHVSVEDLKKAVEFYRRIIERFCK